MWINYTPNILFLIFFLHHSFKSADTPCFINTNLSDCTLGYTHHYSSASPIPAYQKSFFSQFTEPKNNPTTTDFLSGKQI